MRASACGDEENCAIAVFCRVRCALCESENFLKMRPTKMPPLLSRVRRVFRRFPAIFFESFLRAAAHSLFSSYRQALRRVRIFRRTLRVLFRRGSRSFSCEPVVSP
ncbi:MAG: hypothetical protein DBX55_10415 [Verrucomicrobia bacterium]|nr:MAG: hypothetical protein DBX55_10415 [Verrucomicrobiota bacterium]